MSLEIVFAVLTFAILYYVLRHDLLIRADLLWSGTVFAIVVLLLLTLQTMTANRPTPPTPPPIVSELELERYPAGIFTTQYNLRNDSKAILLDCNIDITLQREDGKFVSIKRFWSRWDNNETKKFDVPSATYEKVTISGTARQWGKDVRIEATWSIQNK